MMDQMTANPKETNQHQQGQCPKKPIQISVVVPVSEGHADLGDLASQYLHELAATGLSYEFIFVLKADDYDALRIIKKLQAEDANVRGILMHRWQGEATALAAGFDKAEGEVILTLSSYFQVEPCEIHRVLKQLLEDGPDLVIAQRLPRTDAMLNRALSWMYHQLIQKLTQTTFHDIACSLRAMRRQVAEEVHLYGDMHRFFPLLAYQRGFKVVELPVRQSRQDVQRRPYGPGTYLRRLLDILTVFFLFKFTKRPLRFFGLLGSELFIAGAIVVGYLCFYRLLGFGAIAGRPLLILGALLMMLGAQLFSIGLLGELLIFTHSHDRDYQVNEILE
jgi:glycosyltransferase involved in cell wall biosynthesis